MTNNKDENDIKDENSPFGIGRPETSFSNSYYGATARSQMEKEELEKRFGINKPPQLNTLGMKMLAIINEIVSLLTMIAITVWFLSYTQYSKSVVILDNSSPTNESPSKRVVYAKKENITFSGIYETVQEPKKSEVREELEYRLGVHVLVFILIFSWAHPQIINMEILLRDVTSTAFIVLKFVSKVFTIVLYIVAWLDIQRKKAIDFNSQLDVGIHTLFSTTTHIFFIAWGVIYSVDLMGRFFPKIYKFRLLGKILYFVTEDSIHIGVHGLLNFFGLAALTTGLLRYEFLVRRLGIDSLQTWMETRLAEFIAMCWVLQFSIILAMLSYRHHLEEHTATISFKEFKENFLKFKSLKTRNLLPEEELIETYENGIPRVNVPVRRA